MPTNPPADLYDPEYSVAAIRPLAERACPAIREVVAHGVEVFDRCLRVASESGKGGPLDEHVAVFFAFHRLLESLDAANELIRLGRVASSVLPLRSAFEALLALEYMLQADTTNRAYAFLVGQMKGRIRECDLQTAGTDARLALERDAAAEGMACTFELNADAPKVRAGIEALLQTPRWRPAADAWDAAKLAQRGRRPAWYSLFDGPKNLRELAAAVRKAYPYALLYRSFSEHTHVADLARVFSAGEGMVRFACIPDWRRARNPSAMAMYFGVTASRQVLTRYCPSEVVNHKYWYATKIKAVIHAILDSPHDA